MNNNQSSWTWRGCTLRPARHEDAEAYFHHNFAPLDAEVARLTGSRTDFTHDEVVGFFHRCVDAEDRRDFLIIAPDGRIIGESVINEIDPDARCANYRVAIFHSDHLEETIVPVVTIGRIMDDVGFLADYEGSLSISLAP